VIFWFLRRDAENRPFRYRKVVIMQDYQRGGVEPPISEVLSDPIVLLVMKSDAVGAEDIRSLLGTAHHNMLYGRQNPVDADLQAAAKLLRARSRRGARGRFKAIA
jgi:hypothetical protein